MLCFSSPLMLLSIQRSGRRRCRLLLFCSVLRVFFPLPRTHRPFKLFMPLFDSILYRQRFSRASVVVTSLAFLHFFLSYALSELLFYLLSMHMFTPHTFFWTFLLLVHTFLSHLLPPTPSAWFGLFLVSRRSWITFCVSYLDAWRIPAIWRRVSHLLMSSAFRRSIPCVGRSVDWSYLGRVCRY